jgi:hypothetical protein
LVWFAVRLGPKTFGIRDAFPDESGPEAPLEAHLAGRIADALGEHAAALLAAPPAIERIDVLAAKLPRLRVRCPCAVFSGVLR